MVKALCIPYDPCFVRALTVNQGSRLNSLLHIGGLSSPDLNIARRTCEALVPGYNCTSA